MTSEAAAAMESEPIETAAGLLGGAPYLKRRIRTRLDVHEALVEGIPSRAFQHLVAQVKLIEPADVQKAVGVSVRTVQRRARTPRKPLTSGQSGRAWQFAEVLAHATDVLGSQAAAEQWLLTPAMALDQRRPIDLLSTSVGAEMVEQLLTRIDYGVYT
jgi:putative toxin-antitoxin system antitoxin component (TIGR02293 family)